MKKKLDEDNYKKIIIEIGSGDGRLLNNLAEMYDKKKTYLIGIETDKEQYFCSCEKIKKPTKNNIEFINEPFENVFLKLDDNSINTVISVLPHPSYIDKIHQDKWSSIYKTVLKKIKKKGFFIVVTELTDDLLQPVSRADYISWRKWLVETFSSIGFKIIRIIDEGSPLCFSSHYLDKFKNDSQRIKIISLVMVKCDL
jgi:SAM-dependent methyltransferase